MKTKTFLIATLAVLSLSAFTLVSSIEWKIQEDHSIKFKGTDAEGVFKTLKGEVKFDQNQLANSSFNFAIDVESINTGNGMKNRHATGKKWFQAEEYPTINFASKEIVKTENGYIANGTLTMHGVSKEISIPFTFAENAFQANFFVNRMDYGIGTMKGMSKKVSNRIDLEVRIPVSQ